MLVYKGEVNMLVKLTPTNSPLDNIVEKTPTDFKWWEQKLRQLTVVVEAAFGRIVTIEYTLLKKDIDVPKL